MNYKKNYPSRQGNVFCTGFMYGLLFLTVCWVTGCTANKSVLTASSEQEIKAHQLTGTWSLAELGKQQINPEKYQVAPFLALQPDAEQVNGNTSCNAFSGKVSTGKETISFGDLLCTKMYCEDSVESGFLSALGKTNRFELKGTQLYLYHYETFLARLVKKEGD